MRPPHPHRWKCTQVAKSQPKTLGEHLKNSRLERHLFQTDIARLLDVDRVTIQNWERGVSSPALHQIPKIVAFLGYDPEPRSQSLLEHIARIRRRLGLTQEDLAKTLGINPVTVYRWEKGLTSPAATMIDRLEKLVQTVPRPTPR